MEVKDYWSTPGTFVGTEEKPNRIVILDQTPDGQPEICPTYLIDEKFQSV